jgi:hypothetical protein
MRYVAIVFTLVAAAFLTAGCMDYSQKIVVSEDGSATVTLDGWLDETLAGLWEDVTIRTNKSENIFLIEFEGKPGIEILGASVETDEATGGKHHRATFKVESSEALDDTPSFGESGSIKWGTESRKVTFEQRIRNETEEHEAAEDEELTRSLFERYTWTYEVVMPGPVTETNGTVSADGRTVTWTWPLFDFALIEEVVMTAECNIQK